MQHVEEWRDGLTTQSPVSPSSPVSPPLVSSSPPLPDAYPQIVSGLRLGSPTHTPFVRLHFTVLMCYCRRFNPQSPTRKDCASTASGLSAEAEEIMQDAYNTVNRLQHQTWVAESAYHQLSFAVDTIKEYARTMRSELEVASQKLDEYRLITGDYNFTTGPSLPHGPGSIQPFDPRFLHTGQLFVTCVGGEELVTYLVISFPSSYSGGSQGYVRRGIFFCASGPGVCVLSASFNLSSLTSLILRNLYL